MKAGGEHAADPITTKILTGLRRAEHFDPLMRKGEEEEEDQDGEVELSLGLSIGGNKRKIGGREFLNGSFPGIGSAGESVDPNRRCRARLEGPKEINGGLRNPVGVLIQSPVAVIPMYVPVATGTRSSNSNTNAAYRKPKEPAVQEAVSKPGTTQARPPTAGSSETKVDHDRMPCVMAKGADGRITRGFLYRYNEKEVSIVCVCHGSSFSPAGFVKHAGGTASSHPLRQITVVTS